jgi:heat shock protein HslJ
VVSSACSPNVLDPETGRNDQPPLEGTSWILTELHGQNPLPGAEPTLTFDSENAVGQTGCNSFGGAYEAGPDGSIRFVELFQTEIFCMGPQGVMDQEADYLSALHQAAFYKYSDDRLEIQNMAAEITLVFEPE